jgi:hypothetical protein
MIKALLAVAAVSASALFAAASGSSAPPPPNLTCSQVTQTFSGTAHDLTVPANGYCDIENATITHDLIVQQNSGGDVTNSTIQNDARYADESGGGITGSTIGHDLRLSSDGGADVFQSTIGHDITVGTASELHLAAAQIGHDVIAHQPETVQTGANSPDDRGHVQIGNDLIIDGSPGLPDPTAFVFDGMCDLSVGHDLRITNRWVTLGIGLGAPCADNGEGPVSVGNDLFFSGNQGLTGFFGPSSVGVSDVTVGRDLTVTRNSAAGSVVVGNNTVAGNATCRDNNPAAVTFDGPNSVGGTNNGCP